MSRITASQRAARTRQLQKALAIAGCIRIAAEYGDDGEIDLADALAGLLFLLEAAAVMLDQPEAP